MKEIKFVLSLMTPRVWAAALVLLALALIAGLGVGGYIGHRVADGKAATRIAQVNDKLAAVTGALAAERLDRTRERLTHAENLAVEVAKVAAIEQQWKDDLGDVAEFHKEQMDDAQKKINALRADVLAGAVRLSVAVKAPAVAACGDAPGQGAAAAGGDQETRAELVPQVAHDLVGIVADGDAAVLDLNACIDAYQAIERKQAQQ